MILLKNKNKFLISAFVFILGFISADIYAQSNDLNKTSSEKIQNTLLSAEQNQIEDEQNQPDEAKKDEDEIVAAFKKSESEKKLTEQKETFSYTKQKTVPEVMRPKKPSASEIETSLEKNEKNLADEYENQCSDTFKYGLEDEISSLLEEFTKNDDLRFVDEIYDLFFKTKSPGVRNKILAYFTKLKDPCLGNYACEIINDPYDEKKDTVLACFKYVSEAKISEALPGLVELVDKEDENYFDSALLALGELGNSDEAMFLTDFLDRDDLSVSQRQSLMKVLGKIKAEETWEKLAEIVQDEDENSFVRMYAAEAIGEMQKPESEEILIRLFESDDANFRVYVIKGLKYFNDEKSDEIIIQALRDSQYKVRLEAVNCVKEKKLQTATPYLIYRCRDKNEQKSVKEKAYDALASLNDEKANEYLISVLKDNKAADTTKSKIAQFLLEYNYCGTPEIIELAKESLKTDLKKNLRYSLGKEFAKYGRPEFEEICSLYLDSKDVSTQGTGLDIWAKGKYQSLRPRLEKLAAELDEEEKSRTQIEEDLKKAKTEDERKKIRLKSVKKANANAAKAKRILLQTDSISGKNKTSEQTPDAVSSAQSSSEPKVKQSEEKILEQGK